MSSYRLVRAAEGDLREIFNYWSERASPDVALRILAEILETIMILAAQPKIGVSADQFGLGVRKFPAGKYLIYYTLRRSKGIVVLHVFHGARDQRKAWKSKPKRPHNRRDFDAASKPRENLNGNENQDC